MKYNIRTHLLRTSENQFIFRFDKGGIMITKGYWSGCYLESIYEGDHYFIMEWLQSVLDHESSNFKTKHVVEEIIREISENRKKPF